MPSTDTPTLGRLLNARAERLSRNLGVACPGVVVSFDADARTCSVQPAVHRLIPSEADPTVDLVEELAVEVDVPVCWPAGRGFHFAAVLEPGDPVLLVVCDRDIGPWRQSGRAEEPMDGRLHDYSNCVAIPCLEKDGGSFPRPSDSAALASKVDAALRDIANLAPADNPASTTTAVNAIIAALVAFKNPTYTVGSEIFKLGS